LDIKYEEVMRALADKCYGRHRKAAEEECGQRTPGKRSHFTYYWRKMEAAAKDRAARIKVA